MITNFIYFLARFIVQFHFSLKYKIRVSNKDKLPKKYTGGYIIACNHQSYTDPPMIAAVVKARFSFMAKKELFARNPFFALLIKACGAFPVERGAKDNSAIERAVYDIKRGRVFVIFPEGTRSKDGTIGRAKSGVALIAANAGVPVLPVCIVYGLGGKKRVDFAVGDMIPANEIRISEGVPDRKELKRVSERIMNSVKELQTHIRSVNEQ
jgi:1-acyl-sn-glycerol-3-phosphate acyltransferase